MTTNVNIRALSDAKDDIHPDPRTVSTLILFLEDPYNGLDDLRNWLLRRFEVHKKAAPVDLIENVIQNPHDFDAKLQLLHLLYGKPESHLDFEKLVLTVVEINMSNSALFVCYLLQIYENPLKQSVKDAFQNNLGKSPMLIKQILSDKGLLPESESVSESYLKYVADDLVRSEFVDPFHLVDEFYEWIKISCESTTTLFPNRPLYGYYAPYFALCQRSGSGKTHLLYETGKTKTFMVYALLDKRKHSPTPSVIVDKLKSICYPQFDEVQKEKKETLALIGIMNNCATAFLAAVMKYLLEFVPRECKHSGAHSPRCFSKFFSMFTSEDGDAQISNAWKQIITDWEIFEKSTVSLTDIVAKFDDLGIERIVLSFDEARELIIEGKTVNSFQIIRDALSYNWQVTGNRLSMIVTDTNSTITNFTPSISGFNFHSSRVIPPEKDLYPPFYFFNSQDIKSNDYLSQAFEYIDNQSEQRFAGFFKWRDANINLFATLGSPLWAQKLSYNASIEELLKFAKSKLLGSREITREGNIAALSSRCSIKVLPSTAMACNLVANHMGMLRYLSNDRRLAFIEYPSDPVFAAATISILDEGNSLECLNDLASEMVVDLGKAGESVLQIILQAAIDRVLLKKSSSLSEKHLMSIDVTEFLITLFGYLNFEKIKGGLGNDDAIFKGRIFFNHGIQAKKTVTPRDFFVAIIRGALIVGSHNQPAWDIAVPVVLEDGTPVGIFIDSKNYAGHLPDSETSKCIAKLNVASIVCSEKTTEKRRLLKAKLGEKEKELKNLKLETESPTTQHQASESQTDQQATMAKRIEELSSDFDNLRLEVKNFTVPSQSLHILVNFCQAKSDRPTKFDIDPEQRSIIIQGDCIGSVFSELWGKNKAEAKASLDRILKAGSEEYFSLSANDKIRKAFIKSFPASDPFDEDILKTKADPNANVPLKRQFRNLG